MTVFLVLLRRLLTYKFGQLVQGLDGPLGISSFVSLTIFLVPDLTVELFLSLPGI